MEAIFRDGSRQFRVRSGSLVDLDLRDAEPGSLVEFDQVLWVADGGDSRIGTPVVQGAKVVGKVLGTTKGPKLVIQYYRRRKNSKKRIGHRQHFTRVEISSIQA
jgi:large subunit ribosomal protein L21